MATGSRRSFAVAGPCLLDNPPLHLYVILSLFSWNAAGCWRRTCFTENRVAQWLLFSDRLINVPHLLTDSFVWLWIPGRRQSRRLCADSVRPCREPGRQLRGGVIGADRSHADQWHGDLIRRQRSPTGIVDVINYVTSSWRHAGKCPGSRRGRVALQPSVGSQRYARLSYKTNCLSIGRRLRSRRQIVMLMPVGYRVA